MLDAVDIGAGTITQRCEACGEERDLVISGLLLGTSAGPDAIVLPACDCGGVETLFRTWEANINTLHRRAVNSLAEHLKSEGQSHPDAVAVHAEEKRPPPLRVMNLSGPLTDILEREAAAQKRVRDQERAAASAAERAAKEEAERLAREEEILALAEARRLRAITEAIAAVNKRLGLPPGSEPPVEEIEAEMAMRAARAAGNEDTA